MSYPFRLLLSLFTLSLPYAAQAMDSFIRLTQSCEEALALSALPKHLRDSANVYVLKKGKFAKTITSNGGYNCLVERNHAKAIIPQCVTPNGSKEILPTLKMRTELIYQGKSAEGVKKLLEEKLAKGEIKQPEGHGINYMMSNYNRIFNNDKLRQIPAHVMFFAPGVENEDIGGSMQLAMKNSGFPFITQPGVHRYMVTMVEHASDSSHVEAACSGQL
ncbi:hypothetical protein [Aliikangiella coralliicola]|uniref:Uncharacterized protein n=1 Tax=Aliikangiella coralliicola TaxID=2592383 RepID=A0A545UFT9_9GAMM|nr:hypothetical protein [Aliikangiella coralliicola]TQV88344.1 hypothetical protein FLL46_07405 [Aliikangiella coralliicola]